MWSADGVKVTVLSRVIREDLTDEGASGEECLGHRAARREILRWSLPVSSGNIMEASVAGEEYAGRKWKKMRSDR